MLAAAVVATPDVEGVPVPLERLGLSLEVSQRLSMLSRCYLDAPISAPGSSAGRHAGHLATHLVLLTQRSADPRPLCPQLATLAASLLLYGVFVPLLITFYDTFVAPVFIFMWTNEANWHERPTKLP